MFSLGLGLQGKDFAQVMKFPKAFAVGLTNQLILLPMIALALVLHQHYIDGFSECASVSGKARLAANGYSLGKRHNVVQKR